MKIRRRQDSALSRNLQRINDELALSLYETEIDDLARNGEDPNAPDWYFSRYNPKTAMPRISAEALHDSFEHIKRRLRAQYNERSDALRAVRATRSSDPPFEFLLKQLTAWTSTCVAAASSTVPVVERTPPYLSGELRPYQVYGVNWFHNLYAHGVNGILADEMGLGKTFQTIAFLGTLKFERKVPGPHLVLCPLSVLGNWTKEFRAWCPALRVYRFHALHGTRQRMVDAVLGPMVRGEESHYDVVITTYEMYLAELHAFSRIRWNVLILDEAHRIKNEDSSTTTNVRRVNATQRFLVTGTPLQNNLRELYALLNFIIPDVFSDGDCFDSWFNVSTGSGDSSVVARLNEILRPVMLRRRKSEVSTNIPPKKEIYVECQLTPMQRDMYLEILSKNYSIINEGGATSRALSNILMNLRKCCNHPYLFDGVEEGPPFVTNDKIVDVCGKMRILDRILRRLRADPVEPPNKVLIFSQMTRVLDIIEDYCQWRGFTFGRIDGNTPASQREKGMRMFNDMSNDMFVFLLSTRAGGLGINLQAANYVILYDSDWNPQQDLQAQDRAHRLGQKRSVTVLRLISGGTVEERIYKRALTKLYLDAMVVQKGLKAREGEPESKDLLGTIRFGVEAMFKSKGRPLEEEDLDVLLNRGEAKAKELHSNAIETQETTLANYDAGIAEANMYEFEGMNYSTEVSTSTLIVEGLDARVDKAHISDACELCNVFPSEIILKPDRSSAIVRCKSVADAKAVKAKMRAVGACDAVRLNFISREALITKEMLEEKAESQEEVYGRGLRKRTVNPEWNEEEKPKAVPREPKIPKPPRLPDFRPHHLVPPGIIGKLKEFYEKETIFAIEQWRAASTSAAPPPGPALTLGEQAEKAALTQRAFAFHDWSTAEAKGLFELIVREGKDNTERICSAFQSSHAMENVKAYLNAFWAVGEQCYAPGPWKFRMQQIQKNEERTEQERVTRALFAKHASAYVCSAEDTYFEALEKRLITLVHEGSYFDPEDVTRRLKLLPEYQFDFYVLTRTTQQIKRELSSILRKLQKKEEKQA